MTASAQALALSRRSILGTFRQPQAWIPGFLFPLLMAAVYAAQFKRATQLPGFPEVDSFLQFLLPATVLQACIFGATNGASDLSVDIEQGFFERLLAPPVSRTSILASSNSASSRSQARLLSVPARERLSSTVTCQFRWPK